MWGWSLLGGMITSIFRFIGWFVGIALVLYIAYELFRELFFVALFLLTIGLGVFFWGNGYKMSRFFIFLFIYFFTVSVQAQTSQDVYAGELVFQAQLKMMNDKLRANDLGGACFVIYATIKDPSFLNNAYLRNNPKIVRQTKDLARRTCNAAGIKDVSF